MLTADLLITDVEETVQDPSILRPTILRYLNAGNLAVADKLLLPNLVNGSGSVTTVTDNNRVAVPDTFHKNIYLAQIDGSSVRVYQSFPLMIQDIGLLKTDTGYLSGLAVNGREIFYSKVPAEAQDIDLMFYRLPVEMTDNDTSYPDGVSHSQEFEDCLIEYVCWRLFSKIEDGMEPGQKINTNEHKAAYLENLKAVKDYCSKLVGPQAEMPNSSAPELFID